MIRHDVKQGSEEWAMLRSGKPTASNFHRILTPTGKLSSQSDYMYRLLAERLLGCAIDSPSTAAMDAGREREPKAAKWYAFTTDREIEEVGICFTDDGRIGASPDRMISGGGLLEIKCPEPHTHVGYLLGAGIVSDYKPQIQGQLWVCEAEWLDSVSFCPPLPPSLVRVNRDYEYINKLSDGLKEFCDRLDAAEGKIRELEIK